jgi:hypothetical protein
VARKLHEATPFCQKNFRNAGQKCLETAKKAVSPATRDVFLQRAKVFTRMAIEFERALAIQDERGASSISTLDQLKDELGRLERGRAIHVPADTFIKLLTSSRDDAWTTIQTLQREHDCEIQYSGVGMAWFIKKMNST